MAHFRLRRSPASARGNRPQPTVAHSLCPTVSAAALCPAYPLVRHRVFGVTPVAGRCPGHGQRVEYGFLGAVDRRPEDRIDTCVGDRRSAGGCGGKGERIVAAAACEVRAGPGEPGESAARYPLKLPRVQGRVSGDDDDARVAGPFVVLGRHGRIDAGQCVVVTDRDTHHRERAGEVGLDQGRDGDGGRSARHHPG